MFSFGLSDFAYEHEDRMSRRAEHARRSLSGLVSAEPKSLPSPPPTATKRSSPHDKLSLKQTSRLSLEKCVVHQVSPKIPLHAAISPAHVEALLINGAIFLLWADLSRIARVCRAWNRAASSGRKMISKYVWQHGTPIYGDPDNSKLSRGTVIAGGGHGSSVSARWGARGRPKFASKAAWEASRASTGRGNGSVGDFAGPADTEPANIAATLGPWLRITGADARMRTERTWGNHWNPAKPGLSDDALLPRPSSFVDPLALSSPLDPPSTGLRPDPFSASTVPGCRGPALDTGGVFLDPTVEGEIAQDVPRTFPWHPLFKEPFGAGQTLLGSALRTVAAEHPSVGYCQGMNFVAAMCIAVQLRADDPVGMWRPDLVVRASRMLDNGAAASSRPASAILSTLIESPRYRMRGLWRKGVPELRLRIWQFDALLRRRLPELRAHFRTVRLDTAFFCAQWFVTLFSYSLPVGMLRRVWDVFFVDGWPALFRVGLALLSAQQETLLGLEMEEISRRFSHRRASAGQGSSAAAGLFGEGPGAANLLLSEAARFEVSGKSEARAFPTPVRLAHVSEIVFPFHACLPVCLSVASWRCTSVHALLCICFGFLVHCFFCCTVCVYQHVGLIHP